MAFTSNPKRVCGDGCGQVISDFYEADSQSFKKGELVYLSNAGAVTACSGDLSSGQIMGKALKDATNVTTGNIIIPIEVIEPGDLWLMRVSTSGTAATCDNLSLVTEYGLDVSSNVWTVDTAETDENVVTVVKYHYDTNGDEDYWVYVRFLSAALQMWHGGNA